MTTDFEARRYVFDSHMKQMYASFGNYTTDFNVIILIDRVIQEKGLYVYIMHCTHMKPERVAGKE
jgi:hypothetical protein